MLLSTIMLFYRLYLDDVERAGYIATSLSRSLLHGGQSGNEQETVRRKQTHAYPREM